MKSGNDQQPLISIVTVVLNNREYLEETILSVIHQTWPNIEYVIVDGGSRDGTLEIIKKYEDHIDCWISEPDHGIYNAMNKGVNLASGKYINFLNADDHFIDRKTVERVVNVLEKSGAQFLWGDTIMFNKNKGFGWLRHGDVGPLYYLFKGIPQQVYFYRRELFEKYGSLREDFKIISDLEFHLRLIKKHQVRHKYIKTPLVIFNAGATSSNLKLIKKERNIVLKEYYSTHIIRFFGRRIFKRQLAGNDVFYPKISFLDRISRSIFKY